MELFGGLEIVRGGGRKGKRLRLIEQQRESGQGSRGGGGEAVRGRFGSSSGDGNRLDVWRGRFR